MSITSGDDKQARCRRAARRGKLFAVYRRTSAQARTEVISETDAYHATFREGQEDVAVSQR